jgi:hypothetical protein
MFLFWFFFVYFHLKNRATRYHIHDDFYFHSVIFSDVCYINWIQIRARMGYLQIYDENTSCLFMTVFVNVTENLS